MSNTAKQISNDDPATIDGLDHVFHQVQDKVQDLDSNIQEQVLDVVLDEDKSESNLVGLREASQISGKARRYLLSLIHKEKIDGRKNDKGAWMVPLEQIQERFGSDMNESQEQVQELGLEVQDVIQDQVHDHLNIHSLFRELQAATYRNGYLESQLANKEEQLKLLPDLEAKAKNLSTLEEVLQSKDNEIEELKSELTILKESKWKRFKKWFLGG